MISNQIQASNENGVKDASENHMIQAAQKFSCQLRRDERVYPLLSVAEEKRWMAGKGEADWVLLFLDGLLNKMKFWDDYMAMAHFPERFSNGLFEPIENPSGGVQ